MSTQASIIDIFNSMSCNDGETDNTDEKKIRELYPNLGNVKENDLDHNVQGTIAQHSAVQDWRKNPQMRPFVLLDIGRRLSEEAHKLSELQNFREKDYSLLIDSFYYYSNTCLQLETNLKSYECVLLWLSSDVPYSVLGSVISGAFGAGCRVLVFYSTENLWFLLFLKQVFSRTMLPNGLFSLVPKREVEEKCVFEMTNSNMVFFGNHLSAMDVYGRLMLEYFSFVNANNTATIIFEFCDLSAAIDKIFYETWDRKSATMWGVSTAVVQESVYQKFLDKLKLRIDQLTDKEERVLIKNCIISEMDRNRGTKPNVPVLKVFSCRTANEGIDVLNSYQYCLGTSIWSENSSQALEVASKLTCNNVWINCHGIIDPSVPFSSSNSGNVAFGGYEGILRNITYDFCILKKDVFTYPVKTQVSIEETVLSAQNAFKKWLLMENKEMYLNKIAASLKDHTQLSILSDLITEVLSTKNTNPPPRSCNKNFYIIQEKLPIGVIAIVLEFHPNLEFLVYLITTAIALGNAVILVSRKSLDDSLIIPLVDVFDSHLPKNLLSVIVGNDKNRATNLLASNPIVQAIWSTKEGMLGYHNKTLSKTLKHIWTARNLSEEKFHSHACIFRRECTKTKIIWLTKVDHFP